MAISGYQRYCLNLQGYNRLTDEGKRRIDLAQRLKPAVCAILSLVALFTQSAPITFGAVALGYWAALLPHHPIDLLYRRALQPLFHAPDLGADPVPRRFACGMAATLLLIGAVGWLLEADIVGYVFVSMVALASLTLVVASFCVGSFSYWLLIRRQVFRG